MICHSYDQHDDRRHRAGSPTLRSRIFGDDMLDLLSFQGLEKGNSYQLMTAINYFFPRKVQKFADGQGRGAPSRDSSEENLLGKIGR
jgi:hypothetical protein